MRKGGLHHLVGVGGMFHRKYSDESFFVQSLSGVETEPGVQKRALMPVIAKIISSQSYDRNRAAMKTKLKVSNGGTKAGAAHHCR